MNKSILELKKIIDKSNSFLILTHIDPDGDAIGSSLALYILLKKENKRVEFFSQKIPKNLNFLPKYNEISTDITKIQQQYDTVIVLDCSDGERIEGNLNEIEYENLVVIDHHITHVKFGDIEVVDANASATCEILYEILKELNNIDKEIAISLYTGIVTDTGCFKYSNVTSKTLDVAKELIEYDINFSKIIHQAFDVMSLKKFNLLKMCLNKIEIIENKIAFLYLNKNELEQYDEDNISEGIVNYGRNIEGIEVSILIKQVENNECKISFRSNEYVDVSKIAVDLGGGGHIHASGASIKNNTNIDEIKEKILREIYKQI